MSKPKTVTIYGRLSFPTLTAEQAYASSQRGSYPSPDVASSAPSAHLLLSQAQWERFHKHVTEEFLPYCVEQFKKGEKKDALEPKEAKLLTDAFTGDPEDSPYNTPKKTISEKTAALAPHAVASIKLIGNKGVDFTLQAIVRKEEDLNVPMAKADGVDLPALFPIKDTVFSMYAGAQVGATVNLYAYHNGKLPGFSASASTLVFRMDDERFGGGVDVDIDEIFMD